MHRMQFLGVDACKGGWFAAILEEDQAKWALYESFADLVANHKQMQACFVDIPIGLPDRGSREADAEARKALPSYLKSSIFNVPVRKAVYAPTKAEAKSINQKLTGKSLSEQSLGISMKIREVDEVLQKWPKIRSRVYESHPETCFIRMAGVQTQYRKKDLLGGLERLRIIRNFLPKIEEFLIAVRKEHSQSVIGSDDVLDSFILAVTAKECKGSPRFFPQGQNEPPKDETGLPMAIWFHEMS